MKKLTLVALSLTLLANTSTYALEGDLELGIFQLNRGEYKAAIEEFKPLVAENYAPAQYQMALIYLNGYGVQKDKQKAFDLISKAAEQNYPEALFTLAVMYSEGDLVEKDLKLAFKYMKKSAEKNLPSAQFNLGVMYANGEGIPKDSRRAVFWYEKSANQNYALAQFNLALMHFEGKGVQKSLMESYVWNYIAAKSGYEPAIKSRDMDEHKLSIEEIKDGRELAERRYQNILTQIDLRTKKITQERF